MIPVLDRPSAERRVPSVVSSPARDVIPLESDGSLAALTAEVLQLRLTVEQMMRSQAETQALSVRLSAQQSRVVQVTGQLDAARNQVDALSVQSQEYESRLASLSAELAGATDREAQWNDLVAGIDQLTR